MFLYIYTYNNNDVRNIAIEIYLGHSEKKFLETTALEYEYNTMYNGGGINTWMYLDL